MKSKIIILKFILSALLLVKLVATEEIQDINSTNNASMDPFAIGTCITSDSLEMQSLEDEHIFTFKGNVIVNSDTLQIHSDELLIFSNKETEETKEAVNASAISTPSEKVGKIERVIATGNVLMQDTERTLKAGKATILTAANEVILEDHPIYEDEDGIVTGHRMILRKNEKKAYVEPGAGERAKVVLPKLNNLNSIIEG